MYILLKYDCLWQSAQQYNRVNEVNNKFYNEAIKLAKQCVREHNLIKILEK